MPRFPPRHPPATPGVPVLPYAERKRDTPRHALPHTVAEKAALCDALLPFVTGLREALWAITAKDPSAYPGPEAIAMGQLLLADVRRLVRGEPMAHYVGGLAIDDTLADRFGLALKISAMETAVGLFRKRYFGWHPNFQRDAWYLCGEYAVEESRHLLPRGGTVPGSEKRSDDPRVRELRDKLAARIEQLKRADTYREPQPLHAPGRETSKEVALRDWPGVE